MATEKEMHELIGRSVIDHDFRDRMMADPVAAAGEVGVSLSEEQLANIQKTDGNGLAVVLDERLPKTNGYFW